jgi:hypothetical protein
MRNPIVRVRYIVAGTETQRASITLSLLEMMQGKLTKEVPGCKVVQIDRFTGFADKDGNKIFEDDIIRNPEDNLTGTVVFGQKQGQWALRVKLTEAEDKRRRQDEYVTVLPGNVVEGVSCPGAIVLSIELVESGA